MTEDDVPKPLSARSALLSLLLGAPADGLSAAQLVGVAAHLGIGEAAARVALSRAVGAGELRREGTAYRLGEPLLARRRHQEERDSVRAWDGSWELVVVTATGRTSKGRAATRALLAGARLAELRRGGVDPAGQPGAPRAHLGRRAAGVVPGHSRRRPRRSWRRGCGTWTDGPPRPGPPSLSWRRPTSQPGAWPSRRTWSGCWPRTRCCPTSCCRMTGRRARPGSGTRRTRPSCARWSRSRHLPEPLS